MEPAKKRQVDSGSSGRGGVHSTAAGSSTGGGSQHSTATAMEPAKKRRVDSGSSGSAGVRSTAAGTSTGGGSQHSTTTTSLLFADADFVDDELKDHLIAGARRAPDESVMNQVKEVIVEFEPDICVDPARIKTKNTDWQLVADGWDDMRRE